LLLEPSFWWRASYKLPNAARQLPSMAGQRLSAMPLYAIWRRTMLHHLQRLHQQCLCRLLQLLLLLL
jgi:hypothetical protein